MKHKFNLFIFKLTQKYPIISKFFYSHDGYREEEDYDEDFVSGDEQLGSVNINETGQYDNYLPVEEQQKGNRMESYNCTRFGLLHALQTLAKFLYNKDWNRSDRYNGQGVTRNGATMSSALDSVRKYYGTVDEKVYPTNWDTVTWNEYYKTIPANIRSMGLAWLKEYEVGYEKVYPNVNLMRTALKKSPLYVSGFAWYKKNGLYRSYGRANHCFMVYGYEEGKCWKVFDSYAPYKKELAWDYKFGAVKILTLKKKSLKYNMAEINVLRKRGYKYIQRPEANGEFYELSDNGLKYISADKARDLGIKTLDENGKLIGIHEEFYLKLLS